MPTRIVFAGGESLLVQEDAEAVVKGLEDISPGRADLLKLTSMTEQGGLGAGEGKAVHIRPASVVYVTDA